ncbi:MAG TPA: hypothetical protein VGF45_20895 [Polyangia bacterium]
MTVRGSWLLVLGLSAGFAVAGACRSDRVPPPPDEGVPGAGGRAGAMMTGSGGRTEEAGNGGSGGGARPADPRPDASPIDASAPSVMDAAVADVSMDVSPASTDLSAEASASACGTEPPDLTQLGLTDALAIDVNGTIYFSHLEEGQEFVGRLRPGGGAVEPRFVPLARGDRLWGLALDSARRRLYAASASAGSIYVIDLATASLGTQPGHAILIGGLRSPSDLAVGPGGDVYFVDQQERDVYRIDVRAPTPQKQLVTTRPLAPAGFPAARPGALAFGPGDQGDQLFVGFTQVGPIVRLELRDGVEVGRSNFGSFVAWTNGMAFDAKGRLYAGLFKLVGRERVVRFEPDGTDVESMLLEGLFAGLAFGRGALACNDLYVADWTGGVRRITVEDPGLTIP